MNSNLSINNSISFGTRWSELGRGGPKPNQDADPGNIDGGPPMTRDPLSAAGTDPPVWYIECEKLDEPQLRNDQLLRGELQPQEHREQGDGTQQRLGPNNECQRLLGKLLTIVCISVISEYFISPYIY